MASQDVELRFLRQRLDRLEARDRLLKRACIACLAVVGSAALMAAKEDPPIPNAVVAHRFDLKDQTGNTRAALFMNDANQPALCLYDQKGMERVNVRILDGPEMWMFDERGNSRLAFRRVNQEPELVFFDKETNKVATRVTVTDQGGAFAAWTPKNQTLFAANSTGMLVRQAFQLVDQNAKVRVEFAKVPASNTYFKLLDEKGTDRIVMFVGEHGEKSSELSFFDPNGQQCLLNLGARNGQTGYLYGSTPDNQGVFMINNTGIAAKTFERR